jgi:hypothetical protein
MIIIFMGAFCGSYGTGQYAITLDTICINVGGAIDLSVLLSRGLMVTILTGASVLCGKEGGTMDYAWEYHPDKPSRPIQSFADVRTILEQEALCLLWLGRGHATLDSFVPRKKLRGIC